MGKNTKKNQKNKAKKKAAAAAAKKVEEAKSAETEEVKATDTIETEENVNAAPSVETEAATVDGEKEDEGEKVEGEVSACFVSICWGRCDGFL